jgi:thiol-disulfide isomerase/thioredoxin
MSVIPPRQLARTAPGFFFVALCAVGCASSLEAPTQVPGQPQPLSSAAAPRVLATGESTAPQAEPNTDEGEATQATLPAPVAGAWLGIGMKEQSGGVRVDTVWRGSPADLSGMQVSDQLLRIGDVNVSTARDVIGAVAGHAPGERVPMHVMRDGQHRLLSVLLSPKPDPEDLLRKLFVGAPAPELTNLRAVQGSLNPSLTSLRGRVWVLEFWASWCVACRALGPTLNQWKNELEVLGVEFLGVTMDPFEQAQLGSREQEIEYATFVDESGEVTQSYHGTALPTLFIVDRTGIIRQVTVGYNPAQFQQTFALIKQLALDTGS